MNAISIALARPTSQARGFTFIELLAASAVFLAGLAGLIAVQHSSANALAQAQHEIVANGLAANTLEVCRMLPFATFAALSGGSTAQFDVQGTAVSSIGAGPAFYAVTALTLPSGGSGLTNLKVTVSWQEPASLLNKSIASETWMSPPSS